MVSQRTTNIMLIIFVVIVVRVLIMLAGHPLNVPVLDPILYAIGDLISGAGRGLSKNL